MKQTDKQINSKHAELKIYRLSLMEVPNHSKLNDRNDKEPTLQHTQTSDPQRTCGSHSNDI